MEGTSFKGYAVFVVSESLASRCIRLVFVIPNMKSAKNNEKNDLKGFQEHFIHTTCYVG